MLELARFEAPIPRREARAPEAAPKTGLTVGLARTTAEIDAVLRLRYDVFSEDLAAVFPEGHNGRDEDRFDRWCEHVIVRDTSCDRIVGTYRILTPAQARRAGGYYAETEFDISALDAIRGDMVEVGRSCTHADYRQGNAIMLLWNGVSEVMRRGAYRYAFGCASISLRDDGAAAAAVWRQVRSHLDEPSELSVNPLHRYPVERLDRSLPAKTPPLIKGYLKLGARVCGEPAWDPDFNSADLPVLLDVCQMDHRYKRHLGLDYATKTSPQPVLCLED